MNIKYIKKNGLIILAVALFGISAFTVNSYAGTAKGSLRYSSIMYSPKGTFLGKNKPITREEFAKLIVSLSMPEKIGSGKKLKLFKDVSNKNKYAPYVNVAGKEDLMQAFSDGTFHGNKKVTMNMAIYSIMHMLGFDDSSANPLTALTPQTGDNQSPSSAPSIIELFYQQGLNKGVKKTGNQVITGADAERLLENSLLAKTKDGSIFATNLGYELNQDGSLSQDSINKRDMKTFIFDGKNLSNLPSNVKVYKNNRIATRSDIGLYDLVYYSKNGNIARVVNNKVFGEITDITPTAQAPQAIKLGDNTYQLADKPLSISIEPLQLGNGWNQVFIDKNIGNGSFVTLVLNMDNKVVGIYPMTNSAYNQEIVGYVLDNSIGKTFNSHGFTIGNTIKIVTTSGNIMNIPTYAGNSVGIGNVATVKFVDGSPVISAVDSNSGEHLTNEDINKLSPAVRALDVDNSNYSVVGYGELKNADLSKLRCAYIGHDKDGYITDLIIRGGFGKTYKYVMVTGISDGYVNYDLDGSSQSGELLNTNSSVGLGAKALSNIQDKVVLRSLPEVRINMVKNGVAYTSNGSYLLPNSVPVYYKSGNDYKFTDSNGLNNLEGHLVKGYYIEGSKILRLIVIEN